MAEIYGVAYELPGWGMAAQLPRCAAAAYGVLSGLSRRGGPAGQRHIRHSRGMSIAGKRSVRALKFAFLIMGDFDVRQDYATIHGGDALHGCCGYRAGLRRRAEASPCRWAALSCGAFGPQGGPLCVAGGAEQHSVGVCDARLPAGCCVAAPHFPNRADRR